jgi:enediyne biosynthesis protein E4
VNTRPFLLYSVVLCLAGCAPAEKTVSVAAPSEWFVDRTDETGLNFTHFNGMTGDFYYPEVMPPGVALLDFDNDGDLDVFVIQGDMFSGKVIDAALSPPKSPLSSRLFRNDLAGPNQPPLASGELRRSAGALAKAEGPALRFTDVTEQARIDVRGYGMGAAAGDYNNDSCVDLYVTKLGSNQLLRNNCDGTFSDVTTVSRTADPGWSISAAFVDVDRDGWLDLFVGQYVNYSIAGNVVCYSVSGQRDYCPPSAYRARPSHLFRNNRDGTFTDITASAGMATEFGPALGIATADFNRDGWIDLYVANDGAPNQLWINQRNGTFTNTALLAGAAVSAEGRLKASMGVDAADFDGDGDDDVFVGELTGQGADLYVNDGTGVFVESSAQAGLRLRTLPFTAFGAAWLDADNDGLLDLAIVNGAVTHTAEALAANERFRLQQRRQLFRNVGKGRFEEITDRAGRAFTAEDVGRGAAFGDLDNDGDTDIVVANDNGRVRVLVNDVGSRSSWIGLRVVTAGPKGPALQTAPKGPGPQTGPKGPALRGRDALGSRVAFVRGDGTTLWRRARADGSYASANDPRVLVGLGSAAPSTPKVQVFWPSGRVEEWQGLPRNQYSTLAEGSGAQIRPSDTSGARP